MLTHFSHFTLIPEVLYVGSTIYKTFFTTHFKHTREVTQYQVKNWKKNEKLKFVMKHWNIENWSMFGVKRWMIVSIVLLPDDCLYFRSQLPPAPSPTQGKWQRVNQEALCRRPSSRPHDALGKTPTPTQAWGWRYLTFFSKLIKSWFSSVWTRGIGNDNDNYNDNTFVYDYIQYIHIENNRTVHKWHIGHFKSIKVKVRCAMCIVCKLRAWSEYYVFF